METHDLCVFFLSKMLVNSDVFRFDAVLKYWGIVFLGILLHFSLVNIELAGSIMWKIGFRYCVWIFITCDVR